MRRDPPTVASRFNLFRRRVAGVDAVEAETRHAFSRHTHETFGVGVIGRGAQTSLSGRGVVEAGAGDMITVNPGEVHDGAPIGEAGRAWRMLYFDQAVIADAVRDMSQGKVVSREFAHPVVRDARFARRFQRLFASVTQGPGQPPAMRSEERLLQLLAGLLSDTGAMGGAAIPRGVGRARSLIDDDPTASLSLDDLARASGLGRFQVLRGFARATGLTPHAYVIQRRIDLARRLMEGGAPLAQAAAASGFADQSHMTRIFVRKYGITPGAYARAMA